MVAEFSVLGKEGTTCHRLGTLLLFSKGNNVTVYKEKSGSGSPMLGPEQIRPKSKATLCSRVFIQRYSIHTVPPGPLPASSLSYCPSSTSSISSQCVSLDQPFSLSSAALWFQFLLSQPGVHHHHRFPLLTPRTLSSSHCTWPKEAQP